MNPADVHAVAAALERLRADWEADLLSAVAGKVSDAHAHALKALTDALKATPDGRPSLLRINRSPSFRAALGRLGELHAYLTGPSEVSLRGRVRDAREALYREACRLTHPVLDADLLGRDDHPPTAEQVRQIRAAAVNGYDPRKFLEGPVTTAKRTLKAALEQAGRQSTPGHVEDDILRAWEARTAAALSQAVITLLIDSAGYAAAEALNGMLRPELV